MTTNQITGRAKGGIARAKNLSKTRTSEIAKQGAIARWGAKATHKGNFQQEFGIDIECYVLNDEHKTAVISQRGMGEALGFSEGGSRFPRFIQGKKIVPYVGPELKKRLENPLVFQSSLAGPKATIHGYDVTILIDVCKAIIKAESDGALSADQNSVKQAHIILGASAKAGIRGLVYALAGYNPNTQEIIDAFKIYVAEEAKKYEKEFPEELYVEWHRLYNIPVLERGKSWHFKHLTVKHIYFPLAKSNGKILDLLRALKAKDGDRSKKLFQFFNDIGARALRMQLGRVLEMAQSSKNQHSYEGKIVERFGGQQELDF